MTEHLAGVHARIAAIQQRFPSPPGAVQGLAQGAFREALAAAAAPAGAAPAGAVRAGGDGAMGVQSLVGGAGIPVRGGMLQPVDAPLTSRFGMRVHPISGRSAHHAGVDFGAAPGTPVRAAAGGVVRFAGERGGYGNLVIVDHGDGLETRYAHKQELWVAQGQRVAAGEALGTVGSTGASTGPHLHFEVRRHGAAEDPLPWLAARAYR